MRRLVGWYSQPCPALASDDLVLGNRRSHFFLGPKILLHHFEIMVFSLKNAHNPILSEVTSCLYVKWRSGQFMLAVIQMDLLERD